MTSHEARTHHDSIEIAASPDAVYDLVSDVTRTGDWSPICRGCEWDDGATGQVGDWFTGHNEDSGRVWDTRSRVIAAERGVTFAWRVQDRLVEWRYDLEPTSTGTRLTETWLFLPAGQEYFEERFGDEARTNVEQRTQRAHEGIPATLAAIKRIAEGG